MNVRHFKPKKMTLYAYEGIHDDVIKLWNNLKLIKHGKHILLDLLHKGISEAIEPSFFITDLVENKVGNRVTLTLSVDRDRFPLIVEYWERLADGRKSFVFIGILHHVIHLGHSDKNLTYYSVFREIENLVSPNLPDNHEENDVSIESYDYSEEFDEYDA